MGQSRIKTPYLLFLSIISIALFGFHQTKQYCRLQNEALVGYHDSFGTGTSGCRIKTKTKR